MQIFFRKEIKAKEIKHLLIQKKIDVVLTSMDVNNEEYPEIKYRGTDDLLDFVLGPGLPHYCVSRERISMRAGC